MKRKPSRSKKSRKRTTIDSFPSLDVAYDWWLKRSKPKK